MRRRAFLLSGLAVRSLGAAAPPARPAKIRIPVWTTGEAAADLDPKAFRARLDGKAVRIDAKRGPSDYLMFILVLDFTGDFERVEAAKQATVEAVRRLPPSASVALLRAQDGMQVVLDPTADRDAVAKAVRESPVSGKAGFLDTVENACRIADGVIAKSQVRAAVVYLTDSSIYNHRADYSNPVINQSDSHDMSRRFPDGLVKQKIASLESNLGGLQAPLFIVQLAYRTDRLEQAYQAGQLQLAAATGGDARFCRSTPEVPDAIAAAFAMAAGHYTLEVRLPQGHGRAVHLQVENGSCPLTYRVRWITAN
jgi:hypothetical protein